MRKRVFLIAITVALIATLAVSYWLIRDTPERARVSKSLTLSLVGRTNGNLVLAIKNSGSQTFDIMSFMEVEFSDPAHPLDYVPEDYHHLTNGWDVTLPPGSTLQFTCPAPTNYFHWRAGVSGIGHRQIALQKALRRAWLFKDYIPPLLALHSEYAWTEWLPPEPAKPH